MRMKQWQIQDIGQMAEENPMNGDLRHWQNYSHLKGFIIPFYGILGCCSDILCLLCSKTRQASTSLYCGFHHFRPYFLKLDKWIKAVCCRLCIYFSGRIYRRKKINVLCHRCYFMFFDSQVSPIIIAFLLDI